MVRPGRHLNPLDFTEHVRKSANECEKNANKCDCASAGVRRDGRSATRPDWLLWSDVNAGSVLAAEAQPESAKDKVRAEVLPHSVTEPYRDLRSFGGTIIHKPTYCVFKDA